MLVYLANIYIIRLIALFFIQKRFIFKISNKNLLSDLRTLEYNQTLSPAQ